MVSGGAFKLVCPSLIDKLDSGNRESNIVCVCVYILSDYTLDIISSDNGLFKDIFLAGTDTSAISIDWVMAELVRHPRVLNKVQAEIRELIGDKGTVTYDDLEGLEYMRMAIKETWRLHAPGPILIPREAMSKFQVEGYDIDPGTRVHVNVWAIGRNPDVWNDPEEFIPERFADKNIDPKGTSFELLPFGSGRRGCPGMYMGKTTVEYTLANLLYHFDWKPQSE